MICRIYEQPRPYAIPIGELLRYAGMPKCDDPLIYRKAVQIAAQCEGTIMPRCVWRRCSIDRIDDGCVVLQTGPTLLGTLPARYLSDCSEAILVLATVGGGVDRMIAAQSVRSLTDSLLADAAGSAAVEALLDAFCDEMAKTDSIKPRISPGYGDFLIENQLQILRYLDGTKNLGICLNDSLLMTPVKSVSALIGIRKDNHV